MYSILSFLHEKTMFCRSTFLISNSSDAYVVRISATNKNLFNVHKHHFRQVCHSCRNTATQASTSFIHEALSYTHMVALIGLHVIHVSLGQVYHPAQMLKHTWKS
jgi:hypothetical protein